MEDKKVIRISLSTFFLFIAIIIIIVMGIFIYKLYNEKTIETEKSTELQAQINNLNITISNLQGKINSISEITTLTGEYKYNEEYECFTYNFSGHTVKSGSLYTAYGTYKIVNNKVKITYTKAEDPDGNNMEEFPNGQTDELTILDENTLIDNNGTKYVKE